MASTPTIVDLIAHIKAMTPEEYSAMNTRYQAAAHKQKETTLLQLNTDRQEAILSEIARQELQLAQKVPGTLRATKSLLKELKAELREVKILRGCLHNGGVW